MKFEVRYGNEDRRLLPYSGIVHHYLLLLLRHSSPSCTALQRLLRE
ncbi:unnamed protein product [Chondrus crispus]|uniref:Uncharacterized protein n=1 Tax=Chondrus crispus TaxID=2769 RepID=R7QJB9_CHOCR|nr:unnamed protein product [Chondrus crispus]XP_005717734.1 unnamed protein product [Chondrus crispus]CDF37858.1 unnamed protein product [Chondrus crispus]CDF37863.1 unnamed protein product [Chondrus crispus]|eukprot:XP_005717729.1 unnamed protein product [Chondrus crispus]